jgi:dethiobiotin synthetase
MRAGAHEMTRGIFITGTDTDVGKTVVAAALLRTLVGAGYRAIGMKPVAAGIASGETAPADVRALIAAGNVTAPLSDVSPFAFALPIAPELAARASGATIDLDRIVAAYWRLGANAEAIVVEGAGGALVPLSPSADMLDIPVRLALPVLLVVGIRLGCLNHALLSAHAIAARGLRLAGWVANRIDPQMMASDANVATLVDRLPAPLCADFAWDSAGVNAFAIDNAALREIGFDSAAKG